MIPRSLHAQRGFTFWGWMIVLGIGAFFLTLAAKLAPVYISNYSIQAIIKSLDKEPELAEKSIYDIRRAVQRKFDVNNIDSILAEKCDKKLSCVSVQKDATTLRIDANYEARVHIMGNVDAVVMFKNNFVELPIKGGS
jgi:Domain of unknown function (DUF4845)